MIGGFEPPPLRTRALIWRLRPLGQTIMSRRSNFTLILIIPPDHLQVSVELRVVRSWAIRSSHFFRWQCKCFRNLNWRLDGTVVSSVLYISRYSWVQTQTILLYSTVSMVSEWIDLSFVYWKLVMNFGWCFYLGCFLTVWIRLVLEKPVARNFRPIMSSAYFVIFHGVTSLHMVNILVWVRRLTIILSSIFSVWTNSLFIITN